MPKIKVMTVNIRYQNDFDQYPWSQRKIALFKVIRKFNPDIIGFQEVTEGPLSDLIEEFVDYTYYGVFRDESNSKEMNPIFVKREKFSLSEENSFWLSENPETPNVEGWDASLPRVCSFAKVEHKSGKDFYFFNTHFDHMGDLSRTNSTKLLIETILEKNSPSIISGDFNTTPEMGFINELLLHEDFDNSYKHFSDKENSLTIHDFKDETKGSPIDYIFVTSPAKILKSEIIRDKEFGIFTSDHYQVYCEIEI